jgi:hypothetical protein
MSMPRLPIGPDSQHHQVEHPRTDGWLGRGRRNGRWKGQGARKQRRKKGKKEERKEEVIEDSQNRAS